MRVAVVVTSVKTLLNWLLIFGALRPARASGSSAPASATLGAQLVAVLLLVVLSRRRDLRGSLALARADLAAARASLAEVGRISAARGAASAWS